MVRQNNQTGTVFIGCRTAKDVRKQTVSEAPSEYSVHLECKMGWEYAEE